MPGELGDGEVLWVTATRIKLSHGPLDLRPGVRIPFRADIARTLVEFWWAQGLRFCPPPRGN